MEITNLAADTAAINIAQDKIDKNKQWLKNRSSDIFIDETVKVLNRMIEHKIPPKRVVVSRVSVNGEPDRHSEHNKTAVGSISYGGFLLQWSEKRPDH